MTEDSLGTTPVVIVTQIDSWVTKNEDLTEDISPVGISPIRELPIIYARIAGLKTRCLIDTGACISVASQAIVRHICSKVKIPRIPISSVKIRGVIPDKSVICREQAYIPLEIGSHVVDHAFIVMCRMQYNIILGADFMRRHNVIINMGTNEVIIEISEEIENIKIGDDYINEICDPTVWVVEKDEEDEESFELGCYPVGNEGADKEKFEELNQNIEEKVREAQIPEENKNKLEEVLKKHCTVFGTQPGRIPNFKYALIVTSWEPFRKRPYPVAEVHYEKTKLVIKEMEENGLISKCPTSFLNPLVVVKKGDNSVRVCLDARAINERLIPEYDRAPVIKDIVKKFSGKKFFTAIDLTASYHHIELDDKSRLLTGFLFDQKTYVFNRLPFGIKNAGCALIRAMDRNLDEDVKNFTVRYVDDILIATDNLEEHLCQIDRLLENLHCANFKVNIQKSHFCQRETLFLGHVIDGEGVRPNPLKIQSIEEFDKPTKIKQIRRFLGMCQFFADHCPGYTEAVAPLQDLLKRNNRWKWEECHDLAFQKTKELLKNSVKLGYPDYSKEFLVQTDASTVGVGAVLYQEGSKGDKINYISFTSRKLRKHEERYTVTELEMLAVVHALQHWQKIVYGYPVVVKTDHKALTFIINNNVASDRVCRWALFIQQFNLRMEHCSGKSNALADFLSRNPDRNEASTNQITISDDDEKFLNELRTIHQKQKEEPYLNLKIKILKNEIQNDDPDFLVAKRNSEDYHYFNDLLHKYVDRDHTKLRIVVPQSLKVELVWYAHRMTGHGGIDKVLVTLMETFVWAKMRADIADILRTCDVCQRIKRNVFLLKEYPRPILPEGPNDVFACDLFGPLPKGKRGNRHIFVCMDVFSKFVILCPVQKATSKQVINRLKNVIIPKLGTPRRLISDHGTCFTSNLFKETMDELGIHHILCSIRYPNSNPSERVMQEIAKFCRVYCPEEHWKWVDVLPIIMNCINNTVHESTGEVPSVVHFNLHPERPWQKILKCPEDVQMSRELFLRNTAERLKIQAAKREKRIKGKRFHRPLRLGELVLVRKPAISDPSGKVYAKFANLYKGPYKIIEVLGNNSYRIQDLQEGVTLLHNAANLKVYYEQIQRVDELNRNNEDDEEGDETESDDPVTEIHLLWQEGKPRFEVECEVCQREMQVIWDTILENHQLRVEIEEMKLKKMRMAEGKL